MPLVFDLDSHAPLVVATAAGAVLPADWRDGITSLVADPTSRSPARAAEAVADDLRAEG